MHAYPGGACDIFSCVLFSQITLPMKDFMSIYASAESYRKIALQNYQGAHRNQRFTVMDNFNIVIAGRESS
jgi:hypothetical protein